MFKRSLVARDRAGKATKSSHRRSFKEYPVKKMSMSMKAPSQKLDSPPLGSSSLMSSIVTITVGAEQRLFAAHEDVLSLSPFFSAALRSQFLGESAKRIDLPDVEPEIFSCVLEYLYKGDYYPRLLHNKRRNAWELEDAPAMAAAATAVHSPSINSPDGRGGGGGHAAGPSGSAVFCSGADGVLLKDTVVYCAAEKFGLEELKRLALRKQGLQSGIEVGTVLRSARYAYDHTPDTDSRLRAHYLALIIRCRKIFKRSGIMQMEMEMGGKLFFDLFVSLCNHVDDIYEITNKQSPRFI